MCYIVVMKDLVIVVHGGNAGFREDDGVAHREMVKNSYSIDRGAPTFGEVLDRYIDVGRFDVLSYIFPNPNDAHYQEWARFLEQVATSALSTEYKRIILIGHSLGTVTLQKYLAEHNGKLIGKKVDQLHLIGSCIEEAQFHVSSEWGVISDNIEQIFVYHSEDDSVCPFAWGQEYHQKLTGSVFHTYTDLGHFEVSRIPELENHIQAD